MPIRSTGIAALGFFALISLTACDRDAGDRRAIADMMRPMAQTWLMDAETALNHGLTHTPSRQIDHAWMGLGSDGYVCGTLKADQPWVSGPKFMWKMVGDGSAIIEGAAGWTSKEWSRQCGKAPAVILAPDIVITRAFRYPAAARAKLEAAKPAI